MFSVALCPHLYAHEGFLVTVVWELFILMGMVFYLLRNVMLGEISDWLKHRGIYWKRSKGTDSRWPGIQGLLEGKRQDILIAAANRLTIINSLKHSFHLCVTSSAFRVSGENMWLSDLSLGPTSVREEWGSDFYKEDQVHGIFLMSRIDKREKISQRHTGSLDKQMTAQAAWKKEKICYTLVHRSCRQYSSFWWSSTSMKAGNYTTFFPVPKTWQK